MRDDFPGEDPKKLWQNQPTEPSTMTLEKIRQKARELRAKTRRELFGIIAVELLVVAGSSAGVLQAHDLGLRLVFGLAVAFCTLVALWVVAVFVLRSRAR